MTTIDPALPLPYRREPTCPFDPAVELRERCAAEPVTRIALSGGQAAWLISRYADARRVLGDVGFSSMLTPPGTALPKPEARSLADELRDRQPGTFLEYDPPEHTYLRGLIAGEFTAARMRQLAVRVEQTVNDSLDAIEAAGPPVDLVEAFALPVPSQVICELLGVPYPSDFDFAEVTRVMTDMTAAPEQLLEARDAIRGFMRGLVKAARRNPGENLLGRLIRQHGERLSDEELVGIGNLFLIAGHETTAMMLGAGTLALLQHPEQLAIMRDDPTAVYRAVEELLRYVSIANHGAVRTATYDATVGGKLIRAGDTVVVSIPMANRDVARYEDPYRFDITREPRAALAFGYGPHHCVAAPMARMELQIAYPALLRRFPSLQLAIPFEEVPFRTSNATFGVHALPVTW